MTNTTRTMALSLAFAAIAVMTARRASSQAPEPARPAPAAPQEFRFPHVNAHTLANGLRVYVVEDHSAQVVAVRAVFSIDSTFDPVGKDGLYQVTFTALREGTTTRTPAQLADASARIGTAVAPNAFSTVPSQFESALALMGDMLMNPS